MKKYFPFTVALILVMLLIATGCAGTPTPAPSEATRAPAAVGATAPPASTSAPTAAPSAPTVASAAPKSGGQAVVAFSQEPDRFWSPFTGLVVSNEIGGLMNHTLFGTNEKNEYYPLLAKEVPTVQNGGLSADSLTWTIRLRNDVKWHDGQPLTSADAKFTYEVMVMDGTDVSFRAGWTSIASVETPDDYTVVYKFKNVYAPFMSSLATVPILPKHILGGLTAKEINGNKWFRAPVGTGPFMFKEWLPGDRITLVKNPNYFLKGQPYLDRLIYRIVPDANTLLNITETGEADLQYRVQADLATQLANMKNVTTTNTQSLTPWLLYININRPIFKDVRTRQALAYGFDKELILKQVYRGFSERADGPISPQLWAYNPNITKYFYDAAKAKSLLDAVGWKDDGSGVRKAKGVTGVADGTPLQFEIANISGEQIRVQLLSIIVAQWKDIGIKADIRNTDVGTMFGNMLPNNNFDMTYSFIGRNEDPDIGALYLDREKYKNRSNYGAYSNPKVDELILASQQTADQEKRKAALMEAQKMISDEVPQLFIGWRANTSAINKRLHGYKITAGNNEMWNAFEWWVE